MSKILTILISNKWKSTHYDDLEFSIQGAVFDGSFQKTDESLVCELSKDFGEANKTKALLNRNNGFHAIVTRKGKYLFASVDRVRSIPLFYGQHKGKFYLSDSAECVRQQVCDLDMDPLAREEFLLSGYVTGCETLYPNVKQLQAGEYLVAEENDKGVRIQCQRYYRFLHNEPAKYEKEKLHSELEVVTENAIKRLIKYADGRQIVLPLSGGYDSRLIATMLKRFSYPNVLCFTYGLPGNKEAEYSRRVAKSLDFPWTFVEYSNEFWSKEWSSPEAQEYRKMAANHVSLPHIQDWLAIKTLLVRKEIHKNAVIVPGHSGDFVAGSHIPDFVFLKKLHDQGDLLQAIIKNNLSNIPKEGMTICKEFTLESRLLDRINMAFDGSDVGVANLYETWDWQERQAKYIVNSVRVYDQFRLDWWLPLWDAEFMEFWQNVPLILRKERIWFKKWIVEQYLLNAVNKEDTVKNNAGDSSGVFKLAKNIAAYLPAPIYKIIQNARNVRTKNNYSNHFLAFGGLVNQDKLSSKMEKGSNIIGIYSELFINNEWN